MRFIMRTTPGWDTTEYSKVIPQLELCVDQAKDAYQNFLNALELAGTEPCVHLEDDIVLCKNFVQCVSAEVEARPNEVIQFFSARKKDDLEIGSRHILGNDFRFCQCFYLPANIGLELLEYGKKWSEHPLYPQKYPVSANYDLMMAYFFHSKKMRYWNVIPNLVDHKPVQSRIDPKRSTQRRSFTFNE